MSTSDQVGSHRVERGTMGAAWRSELARLLPPHVGPSRGQPCDPMVVGLQNYHTLQQQGAQGLAQARVKFPLIAAAEALNSEDGKTDQIKLMVLADMPRDEIGQRMGVEAAAIEMWEQLYFDVRDLRHAAGWLAVHVIEKARKQCRPDLASRMKLAICAGPVAVRALLDAESGMPFDEADRLFQRHVKLHVKFDYAVNMPLESEKAKLAFLKLYSHLQIQEKRITLAREKLTQRCAQLRHRCSTDKSRMAFAAKQEEAQLEENQERRENALQRKKERQRKQAEAMELAAHRAHAERLAMQARIAASPLSQLTWNKPPARELDVGYLAPLTDGLSGESRTEGQPGFEPWDTLGEPWESEFNTAESSYVGAVTEHDAMVGV